MPRESGASAKRSRGRPRSEATRGAIIDATLALLAERGFQDTTMDAIAAQARDGKNTIYRRWCSKEELIADALRELTGELEVKEGDDVYALLLERIRDYMRVLGDPVVGRILPGLLGELQRNPAFALAYDERVVRPRRQAIIEILRRALERGELRGGTNPERIADLLIGPPFLRLLLPSLPKASVRYAEELLATIWDGIGPAEPRRPGAGGNRRRSSSAGSIRRKRSA